MPTFRVDRLWPDPAADLDLDEAFADLSLPAPPPGRPLVGVNMVTSIDGRAQLGGKAEGLSGRADRRLLQLHRVAYDAVGSGVGTLRADDFYSHLPADLGARAGGVIDASAPQSAEKRGPNRPERRRDTRDQHGEQRGATHPRECSIVEVDGVKPCHSCWGTSDERTL